MKLSQYLFFCLFITLTKSQQVQYKYFNYTENKLEDQDSSPLIADIKTYDDGTILVHIIRNVSNQTDECSKIQGMSLEQRLRIRLIFLNGTVKEVDPKLNIDSINYCLLNSDSTVYKINKFNNIITYLNDTKNNNFSILHNLVNPITVYPLQKPFILITYVNTTNSSDPTSYRECGEVIDWDGKSRSNICFNDAWVNSITQINANKKFGFLRCSPDLKSNKMWQWQQYSIDDYGYLTYLTNLTNLMPSINDAFVHPQYSLITIVSTIDSGYLAIFNYTLQTYYENNSLSPRGGLCANFIPYNHTRAYSNQTIEIYQITQPNMIINSVNCDESDKLIICIASISNNITTSYVRIYLYSSGNVEGNDIIKQSQQGLRAKIMPFGGYILGVTACENNDKNTYHQIYAYSGSGINQKSSEHFLTNYFGVNAIMQNNTFLLASPYINDNVTWSLLTIPLPIPIYNHDRGYDNVLINKTIPSINDNVDSSTTFLNITFNVYIALSMSTSNFTIYKASDNSIRQRISATMYDFYKISSEGYTVSIKVINSTFNEDDEQYFVTMDNNFVKYQTFDEPIKGIHDSIWILKTDNAITGSVRLTRDATKQYSALFKNNQSAYIDNLLNELAEKVPINRSCLKSDNRFHNVSYDQVVILISIDIRNNEIKRIASETSSDLNIMIIYKNITTFSFGITNDLDQDYGFKPTCKLIIKFKNPLELNFIL
ncbi:hypothetical protein F8M41_020001 [Gigaspora margarita]|uniref:Uncharacterized protein n=1 Tax=Gigaspora margarita TaxID=4874 RepID=A0A8H4EK71_GIGMA|nr:hypothetical protein F8M41_020001 [Gigaspora margarita]